MWRSVRMPGDPAGTVEPNFVLHAAHGVRIVHDYVFGVRIQKRHHDRDGWHNKYSSRNSEENFDSHLPR